MADTLVIPGDAAGLEALASQMRGAAGDIASVQSRVAANGLEGEWIGQASDNFRAAVHELPGELVKIVDAFEESASAVSGFAARLSELQQAAAWHNQQVARAEDELREAESRAEQHAQSLRSAERAHATATDPVSLANAQSLLDAAQGRYRQSVSDVESIGSHVGSLASNGNQIANEYNQAVATCAAILEAVKASAGRTFLHWVGHAAGDVFHHVEDGIAAAWHTTEGVLHEMVQAFDHAWKTLRTLLKDVGEVIAIAAMGVLIAGLFMTGAGAPVALFLLAGAGLAINAAILGGDAVVANTSDDAEQRDEARKELLGDGVDTALSTLGAYGAAGAAGDALTSEAASSMNLTGEADATASDASSAVSDSRGPIEKWVTDELGNRVPAGDGTLGSSISSTLSKGGTNAWRAVSGANAAAANQIHGYIDRCIEAHVKGSADPPANILDELSGGPQLLVHPL